MKTIVKGVCLFALLAFVYEGLLEGAPSVDRTIESVTEVWVDDDYCDTCANDGHTWGSDAFDKIQGGIDSVSAGGTVHVLEGTYTEQLEITKALILSGAGMDACTLRAPIPASRSPSSIPQW